MPWSRIFDTNSKSIHIVIIQKCINITHNGSNREKCQRKSALVVTPHRSPATAVPLHPLGHFRNVSRTRHLTAFHLTTFFPMALRKAYYFHGLTSNNTNKLNATWLKEVNTKRARERERGKCEVKTRVVLNIGKMHAKRKHSHNDNADDDHCDNGRVATLYGYPQKKSIAMIYGWRLSNIKKLFPSFDTQSYTNLFRLRKLSLSLSLGSLPIHVYRRNKVILIHHRHRHQQSKDLCDETLAYSRCPLNHSKCFVFKFNFSHFTLNRQYTHTTVKKISTPTFSSSRSLALSFFSTYILRYVLVLTAFCRRAPNTFTPR